MTIKRVWTTMYGKPERLFEEVDTDETGRMERHYRRADGSSMHMVPNPLVLFRTKKLALKYIEFNKRVTRRRSYGWAKL